VLFGLSVASASALEELCRLNCRRSPSGLKYGPQQMLRRMPSQLRRAKRGGLTRPEAVPARGGGRAREGGRGRGGRGGTHVSHTPACGGKGGHGPRRVRCSSTTERCRERGSFDFCRRQSFRGAGSMVRLLLITVRSFNGTKF
jgi:hypothetical protein